MKQGGNGGKRGHQRFSTPVPHHEAAHRMNALVGELQVVATQVEKYRRLVWMMVNEAGGRVKLDAAAYKACCQGPPTDYVVKLEPSEDQRQIILTECDEEGNERKIIIP